MNDRNDRIERALESLHVDIVEIREGVAYLRGRIDGLPESVAANTKAIADHETSDAKIQSELRSGLRRLTWIGRVIAVAVIGAIASMFTKGGWSSP